MHDIHKKRNACHALWQGFLIGFLLAYLPACTSKIRVKLGESGALSTSSVESQSETTSTSTSGSVTQDATSYDALIDVLDQPADKYCEYGQKKFNVGLDDGSNGGIAGNGLLEAGEIRNQSYFCAQAPSIIWTTSILEKSDLCLEGGFQIQIGKDQGGSNGAVAGDGKLTGDEIEETRNLCNGATGTAGGTGFNGASGYDSVIAIVDEPPGANCPNGGQKMTNGLDDGRDGGTARNGVLEESEVRSTSYICNGIANALDLAWLSGTKSNHRTVTAVWAPAPMPAELLLHQELTVFSDKNCLDKVGDALSFTVAGTGSADVTVPIDGTYFFNIKTFLKNGLIYSSGCVRNGILVDTAAPASAQGLSWNTGTVSATNSVEAIWTISIAADVAEQELLLYSGPNCANLLQTISSLGASASSRQLLTPGTGEFSYRIISIDHALNQSVSNCSTAITINSYETISIDGAPQGTSSLSTFTVIINSSLSIFSAYAYALTNALSCPETGYSSWISAGTPLLLNTETFADGPLRLCVVSKDSFGNERPPSQAVSVTWTKAANNPGAANFSPSDGVVHLSWSPLNSVTVGYIVVRRATTEVDWAPETGQIYTAGQVADYHTLIADITDGNLADDLGLSNGTTYYYSIYGYDVARSYTFVGSGSAKPEQGLGFCSQLRAPPTSAACADPSNKIASGNFAGGDGTSNNPFVICTAAQLNNLRNSTYASKFSIVGANIDLTSWGSWAPLPNFTGNFNGNGYHLTGLSISGITGNNAGLFTSAGSSATIENVTIRSGSISGGTFSNIGSIVGSGNAVTIRNVTNCALVSGVSNIGGIVGSIANSQIQNVINAGQVIATASQAGGIVGSFSTTILTNGNNLGSVSATSNAGGVVGAYSNSSGSALINVARNQGQIFADSYAGGICGIAGGTGSISRSQNFGAVGRTSASYVGGIVGKVGSIGVGGGVDVGPPDINRSQNYGAVSGMDYIGGIIGFTGGFTIYTSAYPTLNSNYGSITGNNFVGGFSGYLGGSIGFRDNNNFGNVSGNENIGGILGFLNASGNYFTTHLTNNNNGGDVSGVTNVGGIVGAMIQSRFNSASNTGNVTGSGDYVGGIVGKNFDNTAGYADTSAHTSLANSGTVSGAQYVGGVFGNIANSYSIGSATNAASGHITGTNYVGGIVGGHATTAGANGASSISNAVNYARVSGTMGVGGILGYGTDVSFTTVNNYGAVDASGNFVGGIAGNAERFDLSASFIGLSNYAAVSGANWVGGIFGKSGSYSLSGCGNAVNAPISGIDYVGGIVGTMGADSTISTCTNSSAISGRAYIGGIVGYSPRDGVLTGNTNNETGSVTGSSNYVGGIGGYMVYVASQRTHSSNVNWATIRGVDYVGGIIGAADKSIITNNINRGTVIARDYTAGIIGYGGANVDGSFTSLTNYGAIGGRNWVGGLIGFVTDLASSTGLYNFNEVNGTGQYVGGIIGYYARSDNQNPAFATLQNNGNINGSSSVGGLFGYVYYGSITNSYNTGAIGNQDTYYAGGIGGSIDSVTIATAVNTGSVSGARYIGGFAGEVKNSAAITTNPFWQHLANRGQVSGSSDIGGFFGTASLATAITLKWGINLENDVVQGCTASCGGIGGSTSGSPVTTTSVYSVATAISTPIGTNTSMLLTGFNNAANFLASPPSGGSAFPSATWNYNLNFDGQTFLAWPIGMP